MVTLQRISHPLLLERVRNSNVVATVNFTATLKFLVGSSQLRGNYNDGVGTRVKKVQIFVSSSPFFLSVLVYTCPLVVKRRV